MIVYGYLATNSTLPTRSMLLRLNPDGSVDNTFQPFATNGWIRAATRLADGAILAAVQLVFVVDSHYEHSNEIFRLNTNGVVEASIFSWGDSECDSLVTQPDGRVLAEFGCQQLNRYNTDGSPDFSFVPDLNGVTCLEGVTPLPDGRILIYGAGGLRRLSSDGSADSLFHAPLFEHRLQGYLSVNTGIQQPDGKLIIGGSFTAVDGVERGGIARLNADGTLDTSFLTLEGVRVEDGFRSYPGNVNCVALQADGRVLVAGRFDRVNGVARSNLARLNSDGSLDPTLAEVPLENGYNPRDRYYPSLSSVASLTNGQILIAGDFIAAGGTARPGIAQLHGFSASSGLEFSELAFVAGENQTNALVTIQRVGDVSGGASIQFSTTPATATAGADFIAGAGTLTFAPLEAEKTFSVPLLDDGLDEPDETAALTLSGATGAALFGLERADLRILDNERAGSLDTTFGGVPIPSGGDDDGSVSPLGLAVQSDGRVLVSGSLPLGTNDYRTMIRLNADGSLDPTFSVADSTVFLLALLPDDRIIARSGNTVLRLFPDGSTDRSLYTRMNSHVKAAAVQADGKVLLAGYYWVPSTAADPGFVERLNPDGTLDATFSGFAAYFTALDAVLSARDGKVWIAGALPNLAGMQRRALSRLNSDGSLDTTVGNSDEVAGWILALTELRNGKILAVGSFTTLVGTNTVSGIARFNPDGSLDPTFFGGVGATRSPASPPAEVTAIVEQFNGKLVVAGSFTRFHGIERAGLARLNPDGSLDTSFDPGEGAQNEHETYGYYPGTINALALLADGQILAGGRFNEFNGVSRINVVRINGDFAAELTPLSLSGSGFRFSLTTQLLRTYVLEVSEDLVQWIPVSTNVARAPALVFDDLDAPGGSHLFYRAVQR